MTPSRAVPFLEPARKGRSALQSDSERPEPDSPGPSRSDPCSDRRSHGRVALGSWVVGGGYNAQSRSVTITQFPTQNLADSGFR